MISLVRCQRVTIIKAQLFSLTLSVKPSVYDVSRCYLGHSPGGEQRQVGHHGVGPHCHHPEVGLTGVVQVAPDVADH